MSDSSDFRLAVLTALIGQHGPLPCVHVARVRTLKPFKPGEGPNALGGGQDFEVRYRVEASELRLEGDTVVLELPELERPLYVRGEPTQYETADEACVERDGLCAALGCLPWDRTPLGRPLDANDAAVALRHIQASSKGVKVLPRSTSEISARTFGNHTGTSSDE